MTPLDRVLALLAFAVYIGFFAIVVFSVRHPALIVVCLLGIGFAGYDMWRQHARSRST